MAGFSSRGSSSHPCLACRVAVVLLVTVALAAGCGTTPTGVGGVADGVAFDTGAGAVDTGAGLTDGQPGLDAPVGDLAGGDDSAPADGTTSTDGCASTDITCDGVDDDCDGATDDDACNDDNECTADVCDASSGTPTCTSTPEADGSTCDDGSACTSADSCQAGVCKGTAASCADSNPCTLDSCDAATGACAHTDQAEGSSCNDGSACSTGDVCQGGSCKGQPLSCDDANPCTTDTCDATKGCGHESADGQACDDGDACTMGDACISETCIPGDPVTCPVGGACDVVACDPTTGKCKTSLKEAGAACDDGQACTVDDVCTLGTCLGKAKICDDNSSCTIDSCDGISGNCVHTPVIGNLPCEDGSKCTADDKCDNGVCMGKTISCNDDNPCTDDICEAQTGCFGLPVSGSCEDGNKCTSNDSCANGVCVGGTATDCDDKVACTVDTCDAKTGGCDHTTDGMDGKACDDGSKCTSDDVCSKGDCVAGTTKDCEDSLPCTLDGCDAPTGICTHKSQPAGASCSDGSLCTFGDVCDAIGVCSGNPIPCDDSKVCTIDGCDAKSGACTFQAMPNGASCDDGDQCTLADSCDGKGKCASGKLKDCSDNNPCTTENCETKTGKCLFNDAALPCDDGDACTLADACRQGACKPEPLGETTTLAGSTAAFLDGDAKGARFNTPRGMIPTANGGWIIADYGNHRIRLLEGNKVSTIAGNGSATYLDGPAANARFYYPTDVARNGTTIYVADRSNHRVRAIANGNVTSPFGSAAGLVEGKGPDARLNAPEGVAFGGGVLWIADTGNHAIRRVDADGVLRITAGSGAGFADGKGAAAKFNAPRGIAVNAAGIAFVADSSNHRIRRILPDGTVTTVAGVGVAGLLDGGALSARFNLPYGVALRHDGALVVADTSDYAIRLVAAGSVTTLAGTTTAGYVDAVGQAARFSSPQGVALAGDGAVIVADSGNHRIRRVAPAGLWCDDGLACTVDSCDAKAGCKHEAAKVANSCDDGDACTSADACDAAGACVGKAKSCDDGNSCTVDICNPIDGKCSNTDSGTVCEDGDACVGPDSCQGGVCKASPLLQTLAGTSAGFLDGAGLQAQLYYPTGLADDAAGGVVIADRTNHRIRLIAADGNVSTLAGNGTASYLEGAAAIARFNTPMDVAVGPGSTVYVADRGNNRVRAIAGGQVKLHAGSGTAAFLDGPSGTARFYYPEGIAVDPVSGDVFVADTYNNRIRRIDANGNVTTFAGDGTSSYLEGKGVAARFYRPSGIDIDTKGQVYVADTYNHRVRRIAVDGTTSLLAGNGSASYLEGKGATAKLYYPSDVSIAPDGTLYVADRSNHRIRIIDDTGTTATIAGTGAAGYADGAAGVGLLNTPYGVLFHSSRGLLIADYGNHKIRNFGFGKKSCDDLDACTVDSCDSKTGECSHQAIANCCQPVKQHFKFDNESEGADWVFQKCAASTSYYNPTTCTTYTPNASTQGWHVRPNAPVSNQTVGGLYYGADATNNFSFGANAGTAMSPKWTVPANGSKIEFSFWWDTESGTTYDKFYAYLYVDGVKTNVGVATTPTNGAIVYKGMTGYATAKAWAKVSVDVSAYVGKGVQIQFYFNSGDSVANTGAGVYVDDLKYSAPCSN